MAGFAQRDQNSSVGATVTRRSPVGPGQTRNLNARSGHFAGKSRGVGRNQRRDENSSPSVTRVQPRRPDGKFASNEELVRVYHPDGNKYRPRQPKTSALGIHRRDSGHTSQVYNGKKREQTVFKAASRANTRFGSSPVRGRRIGLSEVGKALGPIHGGSSMKSVKRMYEMGFNHTGARGARNPLVRQRAQQGFDRATIARPKPGDAYDAHRVRTNDKIYRAAQRGVEGKPTSLPNAARRRGY